MKLMNYFVCVFQVVPVDSKHDQVCIDGFSLSNYLKYW